MVRKYFKNAEKDNNTRINQARDTGLAIVLIVLLVIYFTHNLRLEKKFRRWEKEGAVGPMPNLGKQQVVIEYIKQFSPAVFIEAGTYKGKMVYAVMLYIDEIYSIELDETHYQNARRRFLRATGKNLLG